MTFNPIFGVTRITTNTGLLSGQLYEVMVRGVYANGVLGIPSYMNVTTTERGMTVCICMCLFVCLFVCLCLHSISFHLLYST